MNLKEMSLDELHELYDSCQMQIATGRRRLDYGMRDAVPEYIDFCREWIHAAEKTRADVFKEMTRRLSNNDAQISPV